MRDNHLEYLYGNDVKDFYDDYDDFGDDGGEW